ETGIEGAIRFLRRVYTMVWQWHGRLSDAPKTSFASDDFTTEARALRRKTHQTIAKITSDFEQLHLNTSVAALMELFNALSDFSADPARASDIDAFAVREALESLVVMLAPFSPHVAEEMWEALGHEGGLLGSAVISPTIGPETRAAQWPRADAELARKDELEIPVQVNGKLRSRVLVLPDVTEEQLQAAALADERVQALTEGREVVKVIVVPQRLVNIVLR
ncbi:MAG: class I tRNA ligase family protein, partial [Gammaproteobacteria bacterium]